MAEKQGKDFLGEVDLPTDDHRLSPLPPAADVRPRGVVKDLIRLCEESGHVASAKRRKRNRTIIAAAAAAAAAAAVAAKKRLQN